MLTLVEGDVGTVLTGHVSAVLSGATVTVKVLRPNGTTITNTATVTDGPAGQWEAVWQAGDLVDPGVHTVEVYVAFSDGSEQGFTTGADGVPVQFRLRRAATA